MSHISISYSLDGEELKTMTDHMGATESHRQPPNTSQRHGEVHPGVEQAGHRGLPLPGH